MTHLLSLRKVSQYDVAYLWNNPTPLEQVLCRFTPYCVQLRRESHNCRARLPIDSDLHVTVMMLTVPGQQSRRLPHHPEVPVVSGAV